MSPQKILAVFRMHLAEALAYRGSLTIWMLQTIFVLGIQPFIWLTVYGSRMSIGGYDRGSLVAYFFFLPLIESVTMLYMMFEITHSVKEGTLARHLVKPLPFLPMVAVREFAFSFVRFLITGILLLVIYPFVRHFFVFPTFTAFSWWLVPTLLLGMLLSVLGTSIIGMLAFWLVDASRFQQVWWIFTTLGAGYLAPLTFYPERLQLLVSYLPFKMIVYTPLSVLLGTIDTPALIRELIIASTWAIILFLICLLMWRRGLRRVEMVGI